MLKAIRRQRAAIGSVAILGAIATGIACMSIAMSRYPGGNALDPSSAAHSFWFNFLCDLTSDVVAENGRSNLAGAPFARAGLRAFCVALACFWFVVPGSFQGWGAGKSLAVRILGILSVVGLLLVPVAKGLMHVAAVFASVVPALGAGILSLVATLRSSRSRALVVLSCATVSAVALDSVLYARSYLVHPRVVPAALPLFQRLALLLMLTWMSVVAARVLAPAFARGSRPPESDPRSTSR